MMNANLPLGQFENQASVGEPPITGSCSYDEDQQSYVITGAGACIGGERDAFHFVYRRMRGDFIVTMQAGFTGQGASEQRALGWMARTSLDADSAHVSAVLQGDGAVLLQFRRAAGGTAEEVPAPVTHANVIQLERSGSTFILSAARWGEPFTTVQVHEVELGEEVFLGLFVCSQAEAAAENGAFHNVRIVKPAAPGFDRSKDPFGSRLEILNVATGQRRVIYSSDDVFEAPNWTRDDKALVYNSQGRLFLFDLSTNTTSPIDTGEVIRNNNDHVLSFDGTMLAISSHTGPDFHSMIYTVPLEGGQPRQVTLTGPSYLHGWSADDRHLVYTALRGGDYDIYRIPVEGGVEEQLTTTPGLDDGPEYTPYGAYIYFNSVRSGSMQIWRMRPDGSAQEQITNDECNNWFPHISPDSKQVIFVSYLPGEVEPSDHPAAKRVYLRVMPLHGGTPKVVAYLYGGQGTMNVPSWSPDGTKVAFVSNTVPFSSAA